MFKFSLDAKDHFNEQALLLLQFLTSTVHINNTNHSFSPNIHNKVVVSMKDIVGITKMHQYDEINEVAIYYLEGNRKYGFENEGYGKLHKLALGISNISSIKTYTNYEYIKTVIFNWVIDKYYNKTTLTLTDFISEACNRDVQDHEIWMPIAGLYIEKEFNIGNVKYLPINKDIIDNWYLESKDQTNKDIFDKRYRQFQGLTAASFSIYAEKMKAIELAISEIEISLGVLRVYCPANTSCTMISHCQLYGRDNLDSIISIGIENHRLKWFIDEGERFIRNHRWILDSNKIETLKKIGIDKISKILNKDNKNNFQENLINAIFLYSKSSLMRDLSDKLIYILASLEKILLKNSNEPVSQNISERLAFTLYKESQQRKNVIELTKNIYNLRSRFLHHGKQIDDIHNMNLFMNHVFDFYLHLIRLCDKYDCKNQFIEEIDNIKYS